MFISNGCFTLFRHFFWTIHGIRKVKTNVLFWNIFYTFLTLFLDHTRTQKSKDKNVILKHLLYFLTLFLDHTRIQKSKDKSVTLEHFLHMFKHFLWTIP